MFRQIILLLFFIFFSSQSFAESNAETDKKAKEFADKINTADTLIFTTEKQLKENGDKIPKDKKQEIENLLSALKKAHSDKDLEGIDKSIEALNNMWQSVSQDMYKNQSQEKPTENKKSKSNNEDVTDVDFEEVDDDKKS